MVKSFVRWIFAIIGAYAGYYIGMKYIHESSAIFRMGFSAVGILLGLIIAAFFVRLLWPRWEQRLQKTTGQEILAGAMGLCFGLVVAGLIIMSIPGTRSMELEGNFLSMLILLVSSMGSMMVALGKKDELMGVLGVGKGGERQTNHGKALSSPHRLPYKVLDTSAIIDGRIADLCETGFLEGALIVPGFVLAELQRIADSSDSLKRNRGRRGLDILNRMQKDPKVSVKIFDKDFDDLTEVDTKIVRLARMLEAKVVTNDFNLNKVSELYGVSVLNINELSNAIKPVVLPGEEMDVHVIKDGKEYGQGVAYLEDGTMIVVDGGKQYMGEEITVVVTSVLQTAAGRMIFAKPRDLPPARASSSIS